MLLHSSLHIFHRVNVDLPSKQPGKTVERQSASSLPHTRYGIDPAFVHTALVPGLNPAMLLGPNPGSIPGRVCVHTEGTQFSGTNVQCEKGFTFILPHSLSMAGHF